MSIELLVQELNEFISNPVFIEKYLMNSDDNTYLIKLDKIIRQRIRRIDTKERSEIIKEKFYNNNNPYTFCPVINPIFTMPNPITPEFSAFLKIPSDRQISRFEAKDMIYAYIWDNELDDIEDSETIHLDDKLKELFQTSTEKTTHNKLSHFVYELFIS